MNHVNRWLPSVDTAELCCQPLKLVFIEMLHHTVHYIQFRVKLDELSIFENK